MVAFVSGMPSAIQSAILCLSREPQSERPPCLWEQPVSLSLSSDAGEGSGLLNPRASNA